MSAIHLAPEQLYQACSDNDLPFKSTRELTPLSGLIGQQRAEDAVRFAVNMQSSGYNLYVMGAQGIGKHTLVENVLVPIINQRQIPQDWAYLHNFTDPQMPYAVPLPAGQGRQLRTDIETCIRRLEKLLPEAFDDEYYRERIRALESHARQYRIRLFAPLQQAADARDIVLLRLQDGNYAFATRRDGEILHEQEFEALPLAEQVATEEAIADLHSSLQENLLELGQWERDHLKKINALDDDVALEVISRQIDVLRHAYPQVARLQLYFEEMLKDLHANVDWFLKEASRNEEGSAEDNRLRRYQINLLVDHADTQGAPVVYLNQLNHQSLLGCVENMAMMGALVTDFTLIRAGAVHRANGGFLVLDIEQLLMQPFAWEGLKAVLKAGEVQFENLERTYSLVATVSLTPEPIPLDIKVILLGERHLYYELYELDPDFASLFKVVADFEDDMLRQPANHLLYARMLANLIQDENLPAMQRGAVAKMIEHAARDNEDGQRLSLHVGNMIDLLHESAYWALMQQQNIIARSHVEQALAQREKRLDRLRDDVYQQIQRGILQLDLHGQEIGQINALSVFSIGSFHFAQPTRVTANARFGDDTIIDIEREVELGGNLHAKGVLILSGYLGSHYAQDKPLSMSASIVFEQNYGEIDGDSATLAELCALLSAIARLPLRQDLAVTGSMNQRGEVQAVGGINEKIEGFFDVCQMQGLTGQQGVILPASNQQHLMLKTAVIEAVNAGQFHLYAVTQVDEAIALLTGLDVGLLAENGEYPAQSFNAAVAARLKLWAEGHKHDKNTDDED
ncbi:MAG: ATP-binding protein [Methylophaga sp.]|nr:ATP-binding protein [Methylophaga sp.]